MSRETDSPNLYSSGGQSDRFYHQPNMFMAGNGSGIDLNRPMNNFGAQMYRPVQQYPGNPYTSTTLYFPTSRSPEEHLRQPLPNATGSSTNNDNSSGGKTASKWSDEQSLILVQEWKERIEEVESSRSSDAWKKILDAVNKIEPRKTMKQCKDKLRNLKQAYKDAKANNNQTGRGKKTSPHYDIFDEMLGSRPVVTMPGVIQSLDSPSSLDNSASSKDSDAELDDSNDDDNDNDDDEDDIFVTKAGKKRKSSKQPSAKKRARKGKGRASIQDSFKTLSERMLDIQNGQMEAMERAQARSEELMLKLEMEQRKLDEESRRRDQEFFLRMAQLLKK